MYFPALNWVCQYLRIFKILVDNLYLLDSDFGIELPYLLSGSDTETRATHRIIATPLQQGSGA